MTNLETLGYRRRPTFNAETQGSTSPIWGASSNTVTLCPLLPRAVAAAIPPMPAPTTITLSLRMDESIVGFALGFCAILSVYGTETMMSWCVVGRFFGGEAIGRAWGRQLLADQLRRGAEDQRKALGYLPVGPKRGVAPWINLGADLKYDCPRSDGCEQILLTHYAHGRKSNLPGPLISAEVNWRVGATSFPSPSQTSRPTA